MQPARGSTRTYRRALAPVLALTVLAGLITAAIGLSTNLASVLVPEPWIRSNRTLILAVLGALVVAGIAVSVWLVLAARRADVPQDNTVAGGQPQGAVASGDQHLEGATVTGETNYQGPAAHTSGEGSPATAIHTMQVHGPVTIGSPPPAPSPPPPSTSPAAPADRISNLPPRNPHFTGRTDLLDQIHQTLTGQQTTTLVAAFGLGGVGKTQLALEYAHRHADEYSLRWWVPAETALAVTQNLALLAPQLGLPEEPDMEAAAAAVRTELGRREGWLLVFDNTEDPATLRLHLPSGGRVLVTSRNPSFGALGTTLEIDRLPLEEAIAFLLKRTGTNDRDAAERLAERLGRLPLALTQAVGYLDATPGVSIDGYLERLERADDQLLESEAPPDYPEPVARTWLVNVEQLTSTCPAAVELLRLCAFLAPETPIPRDLLTADLEALPEALRTVAESSLGMDEPIRALYRYSLISGDREGIQVHRLVQAVTRHSLGKQASAWRIRTLLLALTAFPINSWKPEQWPTAAAMLPHALRAAQVTSEEISIVVAATRLAGAAINNEVGLYLESRGELIAALTAHEQALIFKKQAYGSDHFQIAPTLVYLGKVLHKLGDLHKARILLEQALTIFKQVDGPDHPNVARILGNLGNVFYDLEDLHQARALRKRTLEIFEAKLGEDHPDTETARRVLNTSENR